MRQGCTGIGPTKTFVSVLCNHVQVLSRASHATLRPSPHKKKKKKKIPGIVVFCNHILHVSNVLNGRNYIKETVVLKTLQFSNREM